MLLGELLYFEGQIQGLGILDVLLFTIVLL